ncbi:hypothetical protein ABPG74_016273 [Tetrahymena malaccensis]
MKVNSYKIKSEEYLQRNVNTTPSFQKLQEKILNIQQKNDYQDQILSHSCNHKTASNSTEISQYSCRDNLIHSEYSSCTNLDSQIHQKLKLKAKDQSYNSIHEVSPLTQKLYDPPKQDQCQQQQKPPRYHTPTRDSIKSNDITGQKQKTLTKTDSKKSQKLINQTSQKSSANQCNQRSENNSKNSHFNPESSPILHKGQQSSQSKANKGKIELSNKKQKEGVTEKDKKIIEKIQKKLQNKSPISKNLKENRSNVKQQNDKQHLSSEQYQHQDQRLTHYENLLQKTPKNYRETFEIKDNVAYQHSKNFNEEEENETNFQQNFLSNLKEKLNEENQLINEQLQKLDKKMIQNQQDAQKSEVLSHLNIPAKDQNYINHYHSQVSIQSQYKTQQDIQQHQLDRLSSSSQDQKNNIFQNMNSTLRKQSNCNLEIKKDQLNLDGFQGQLNNQIKGQITQSSTLRLTENKTFKNLSNSSSSESIKKQKLMISEQIKNNHQKILDELSKSPAAETRATSCKSTKYISNPLSYEKDLNNRFSTEDKSHDYANTTDEDLFSSYSLASRSNKNTIQAKSNHLSASNFDNIMHLYQPGEYSNQNKNNHNKENMIMDLKKQNITDRDSNKSDQTALCSTFRQCVNGNQDQINDLKSQIKQFQYENQQLKSLVQKQENQSFLNKKIISENKIQILKIEQQNQQLIQKNKLLTDKLQKYEEVLQITKAESIKQQKDMQNKFQDKMNQLESALSSKQVEADQLRIDLNKIQQTVDQQIEKTNSQQIKIKNLEQLVSEYSKIESKLFELEDIHESVKHQNESLQQQIEQYQLFEQKFYQIILEVKKSQQNQKSKVVEFSQIIDAYLKLTECIISDKEPSVDVLVGHRRKRSSFLEIKKQEDNQNIASQLESDNNIKQKIKEQSEIVLTYIKGSSEKVQSVLDQSRSLLDKLSDYYMQKFGNGII